MQHIKWFERTFDFSFHENIFPSILERLAGTPIRLIAKIEQIPSKWLEVRINETWSIKENIGHLIDLEPLWQGRLDDILAGEEYLRPTDLTNSQTDLAQHNDTDINVLLTHFQELREVTVNKLVDLSEDDIYKSAKHPRLNQPMRTMDLFLFVAEHDDHHLARITEIRNSLKMG